MVIENIPRLIINTRVGATRKVWHRCPQEYLHELGRIIVVNGDYIDQKRDSRGRGYGPWEKRQRLSECPWCGEKITSYDWKEALKNGSTENN